MKILVAIPCFNEEATLENVLKNISVSLEKYDYQILVVDDGSTDKSVEIAKAYNCSLILHGRNKGVGGAFQSAVDYAVQNNYEILLTIDADGQFEADDLPRLVEKMFKESLDFCSGSRFLSNSVKTSMPLLRKLGNIGMAKWLSVLTKRSFSDVSCGLRGYTRNALLNLNLYGKFTYTQESILELAHKEIVMSEMPITVHYFEDRKSHVSGNLFRYALRTSAIIMRTFRDYYPLRFFWTQSLLAVSISVFFGLIFIENLLRTGKFEGAIYAAFVAAFTFALAITFWLVGLISDLLDNIRRNQERILYRLKSRK
jgi:glycosyltransferase involved in cell wall biosynthesis